MKRSNWLPGLGLGVLILTAACSSSPTGPNDDTEPTLQARYDMTVVARYVRASSSMSCDGEGLFGGENAGEYQYRIVASRGSDSREYKTNNYGQVNGANAKLETSEIDNFANQSWTFNDLGTGQDVTLRMYVTEWDALAKDDYMNNRNASTGLTPSSIRVDGGNAADRQLDVGVSTCGLTLFYDVNITRRDVEVS